MTNLSVFNFESHEVRFVGTANEPWWIAQDICKVLELDDVSKAASRLDDDEKLIRTLHVSGQGRQTLCINESGLYSLVLTSRKAQAKRFKKWLTSEVIPAIRKTGTYTINDKTSNFDSKVAALDGKRRELKQRIDIAKSELNRLEGEYSQLDIEESKLYVLNNHEVGETYIKHKQKIETVRASIYLPKGK
ncbi:MAG TPA: BRO family protein [Nostoc sp.]|uniref:BRO-N domain-containing protein n=1 Tax=Nostoc sp. TaxID=1180 RepID=UPI002D45D97D|nr:BRO family protein [Nostoc sp.]HYX16470.1 BRO family protein [Nostoc sp.]